jgi:hypothetical protein
VWQQLGLVMLMVSSLVGMASFVYIANHPHAEGEPYGFEHKFLWTALFVSFCCTMAAGVALFVLS